jgi:hypothetical protein
MEDLASPAGRIQPELDETRLWVDEELAKELAHKRSIPGYSRNTVGAGMNLGAIEVLERLQRFLRGDYDA